MADHPYFGDKLDAYALTAFLLGRTERITGMVTVTNLPSRGCRRRVSACPRLTAITLFGEPSCIRAAPAVLRQEKAVTPGGHLLESGVSYESGAVAQRGAHKVAVGKTLFVAAVCAIVPLIGNVVASFLTTWTGVGSWLLVPAVGVAVAMLTALIQAYGSAPAEDHPRSPVDPYRRTPVRPRRTPLPRALLITVLVIGIGGLGVTAGIRYAVGYFTGNEPGTSRLVQPATSSTGGLTLTVESVTYTAHFTQVGVAARNQTGTAVSLPLYGYCVLTGSDGTTLQADPFRSHWSETLAPGILQRGVIVFSGHLPAPVLQAALSFTQIFGPGGAPSPCAPLTSRPARGSIPPWCAPGVRDNQTRTRGAASFTTRASTASWARCSG